MASVHLRKDTRFWSAAYYMPTGKNDSNGKPIMRRVLRSTGVTDRAQALQLALSYERAAKAVIAKRWSETMAARFLQEVEAIAGVPVGEIEPTNAFLKRWLESRRRSLAPGSFARYAGIIDDFMKFLGGSAGAPLMDVSPLRVAQFRDAEQSAGKSASTVNKSLMVLAQAFNEAVTTGVMRANPARGLNVKGAKKKQGRKRRAFTFEQFRELVGACDGEWKTLVLLCGYTGGRQQEVAKITWQQIDLAASRLTLHRGKTDDEHWLPIHASLAAHLRGMAGKGKVGAVMPELSKMQRRAISNNFRRAILPRIGIAQKYSAGEGRGKGRQTAEYSLHSLRHSLSTWLNAAGVSEMMRMRLIGHEDEAVSRGYTHTELAQAAVELSKVPGV